MFGIYHKFSYLHNQFSFCEDAIIGRTIPSSIDGLYPNWVDHLPDLDARALFNARRLTSYPCFFLFLTTVGV